MDHAAPVTAQVEGLHRAPHHAQVEPALGDERFDGADPGPAVAPQSTEENETGVVEAGPGDGGQRTGLGREPVSGHHHRSPAGAVVDAGAGAGAGPRVWT